MKAIVTIYVCPTEDCKNYYGSSRMGDMDKIQTNHHMKPTFARKRCPECIIRGNEVMRVPITVEVEVPTG